MTITLNGTTGITTPAIDSVAQFASADMPAGSVLQVVQGRTKTLVTTTSASFVDIGLSATITPSSTSSKILVICNVAGIMVDATSGAFAVIILLRDSTNVTGDAAAPYLAYPHLYLGTAASRSAPTAMNYLDSPSTTTATTYKIQSANSGGGTINFQRDGQVYSTMILMEVAG
tara:strand:- start:2617 stop:3135 length:519 start_codon:yes stop_codon:yes gene_type:complete